MDLSFLISQDNSCLGETKYLGVRATVIEEMRTSSTVNLGMQEIPELEKHSITSQCLYSRNEVVAADIRIKGVALPRAQVH